MKVDRRVYHAGDFKNVYGNLQQGLSGTSFVSSPAFFCTNKKDCEYQGAGFNLEHKRPIYSFSLKGLNLFPTSWQDCKTLNLFNKCLYYWPVYQAYFGDVDNLTFYKPIYQALIKCFEDFYADGVADDERVSKFLRELKESFQIEANDMAEIDGKLYSFLDYIDDNRCLRKLADKLRPIEPNAHNTFPVLSKLMIEGDVDILKSKINKLKESESYLLASILGSISTDMLNWINKHYNDSPDKCAWLEGQADQLFDIAEKIQDAGYNSDLIVDIEEIEKNIEEGSGSSDDVYDFARDISQALKDLRSGKENLQENIVAKSDALYHASYKPISSLKAGEGIWVGDKDYIDWIMADDNRKYIYKIEPKKELNIFDTREGTCLDELKQYVEDNSIEFGSEKVCQEDIDVEDWDSYFSLISQFVDWQIAESPFMVKAAKNLGYDGYVSIEDYHENYFIFDSSNLKIINKIAENISIQYTYDNLKNELENFIDKYELAANIDSMLQKVADLVNIDKKQLLKIANTIASKYSDLYDKTTGRFNNWIAPKDDLFTTQLLTQLGYQGTYPVDDICDSTEWGGTVFHREDLKDIEAENA